MKQDLSKLARTGNILYYNHQSATAAKTSSKTKKNDYNYFFDINHIILFTGCLCCSFLLSVARDGTFLKLVLNHQLFITFIHKSNILLTSLTARDMLSKAYVKINKNLLKALWVKQK